MERDRFHFNEIGILPKRWQAKLSEWRGIYYIFDTSDGKGYVGSAYSYDNILGDGGGMPRQAMAEIGSFGNVILRTSASRSSNLSRRTWRPATSFD